MWDDLYNAETIGSEGGTIIKDEEYKQSCRITLEKCERYAAITCGVYGAMMHTAFTSNDTGIDKYLLMKQELQDFIDKETTEEEEIQFYEEFCSKY